MASGNLQLGARPDSYGFYYGTIAVGANTVRVNVMPPVAHWQGDLKLPGYEPDAVDWIVYADGEEIARVRYRDDLGKILGQTLLNRP